MPLSAARGRNFRPRFTRLRGTILRTAGSGDLLQSVSPARRTQHEGILLLRQALTHAVRKLLTGLPTKSGDNLRVVQDALRPAVAAPPRPKGDGDPVDFLAAPTSPDCRSATIRSSSGRSAQARYGVSNAYLTAATTALKKSSRLITSRPLGLDCAPQRTITTFSFGLIYKPWPSIPCPA
jgi:hypothetical protein